MKIKAWVKTVYGDSNANLEDLMHRTLPSGKSIVWGEDGPSEIDVVAPNIDEDEFAPLNVCPVETIQVGEACLDDVTTVEPTKKDENISCPKGYALGEKTEKINIIGNLKKLRLTGIYAKAMDLGMDVMEPRDIDAAPRVEVKKANICVKREPMPMEKKWVRLVSDSIIGWGGYSEFPFWDIPWDSMSSIADARYKSSASLEEGYSVCGYDSGDDYCMCFKEREDAKNFKDSLKYYDSNKFFEDTKEYLEDDIPTDKITDEKIYERMEVEKQFFWDDVKDQFPSYLGYQSFRQSTGSKFRDEQVIICGRHEGGKWRENVVLVKEEL